MACRARASARADPSRDTRMGRDAGGSFRGWSKASSATGKLMLLLDSEALSAVAHGPAGRRDRVRALIAVMRRREMTVATVAAVLAEVVRGRRADAAVFAGLRQE